MLCTVIQFESDKLDMVKPKPLINRPKFPHGREFNNLHILLHIDTYTGIAACAIGFWKRKV